MRLWYIANIRLPTEKAHGVQIMEMCSAFARAGADVTLVVPTRKNPQLRDVDPFEYYGAPRTFTLRRVKTPDPVWLMRVPGGIYIKTQSVLFMRGLKKFFVREGGEGRKDRDTVFYTRDAPLIPFLLRHSSVVVWEAHTLPARHAWYVHFWNRCRKIIAISNGLKEALRRAGVPEERVFVAPDGINPERYAIQDTRDEIRQRLGLPLDRKVVMYTGQLFDWKGADVLLEVARSDHARMTSDQLLFVFVGGMKDDVERFKRRAEGFTNVMILGHQPYEKIPLYQRSADVLALPNKRGSAVSEHWTSPMKLFEYMASGVPIVASDLPSLREVVNESNAVLVEPNRPEALAKGIQNVLNDNERARRIASQASRDVQRYSWGRRAEKILEVI